MRTALLIALIVVLCVPIHASARVPRNLIANGGFENGDGGLDGKQKGIGRGWQGICGGPHPEIYALDSRVKHSGRFSQRMTCDGFNYKWVQGGGYCYHLENGREVRHPCQTELGLQAIAQVTEPGAIKPGASYSCSVWVKIDGLTESWEWFRLGVYWLNAQQKFISEAREPDSGKTNFGSHDWKRVRLIGTAPANAAFAKVYLHHHFTHGAVWYDDVCLRQESTQRSIYHDGGARRCHL